MSIASLKRCIIRKWRQWVDPEFDRNELENRDYFTDEGVRYYERSKKIINGKTYCLFENEDDKSGWFFRKLVVEDGVEYYVGLDDRDEFNMVLERFLFEPKCSDTDESESDDDFFEELKKVWGDDIFKERSDDCD